MKKSINKIIYILLAVSLAFSALLFTVQAQNVTPAQLQAQIAQLQQQLAQAQRANQTAQVIQLQAQIVQLQLQLQQQNIQFQVGSVQQHSQYMQMQIQIALLQQQLQAAQKANQTNQEKEILKQIESIKKDLDYQKTQINATSTTTTGNGIQANSYCTTGNGNCVYGILEGGASGDFFIIDVSDVLSDKTILLRVIFRGKIKIPQKKDTFVVLSMGSGTGMFDERNQSKKIEVLSVAQDGSIQGVPNYFDMPKLKTSFNGISTNLSTPVTHQQYNRYCLEMIGLCTANIQIIGGQTGTVYYQSNDFIPRIPQLIDGVVNPFASSTKPDTNYTGKEASGLSTSTAFGKNLTTSQSISELLMVCDGVKVPCTFASAMLLLQNVIKLLLTKVAFLLFMFGLFYVGWEFISSGGNPNARSKAKDTLKNLVIGYVVALCAWVIVKTIIVMFAGEKPSFDVFF